MLKQSLLLTQREIEVIDKRLQFRKLTQQDSNYLSRFVRPKLREMTQLDSGLLLRKLEYNQKIPAMEKKIKAIILHALQGVSSITLYGSAVYNNYHDYHDIDVLVTVKKKFWRALNEKYSTIAKLKRQAMKKGLTLDVRVYEDATVQGAYPSSPSLVYQLKDRKTIYGALRLPSKIEIPMIELRMKVDYSMIFDEEETTGQDVYKAIRNLWLVNLAMEKIVDNARLNRIIEDEMGRNMALRLKSGGCSEADKEIGLLYLRKLLKTTLRKIEAATWEKIALSTH